VANDSSAIVPIEIEHPVTIFREGRYINGPVALKAFSGGHGLGVVIYVAMF
jgi:hypothetical protein